MQPARREQRRYVRRQCALPIELRVAATSFPIKAETSDLSPAGCYIRVLSPFPVGSGLDIVLWVKDTKMSFHGTVITADPNLGNGVAFTGISPEHSSLLQKYLDETQAPATDSDFIFH
jgi:PilZ domain